MARNKKNNGFSMDNIVNTDFKDEIADATKKQVEEVSVEKEKIIPSDSNFIDELKSEEPQKVKNLLYFDEDVANHLDFYGDKVGKKNGGKSKFINEGIKQFLKENNLWSKDLADKKRKKKKH